MAGGRRQRLHGLLQRDAVLAHFGGVEPDAAERRIDCGLVGKALDGAAQASAPRPRTASLWRARGRAPPGDRAGWDRGRQALRADRWRAPSHPGDVKSPASASRGAVSAGASCAAVSSDRRASALPPDRAGTGQAAGAPRRATCPGSRPSAARRARRRAGRRGSVRARACTRRARSDRRGSGSLIALGRPVESLQRQVRVAQQLQRQGRRRVELRRAAQVSAAPRRARRVRGRCRRA